MNGIDRRIAEVERELGYAPGTIEDVDGTPANPNMGLLELRKRYERMFGEPPVRTSPEMQKRIDAVKARAAQLRAEGGEAA